MNTRCQYCGKEIADGEDFCSDSCASAYRTATGTKLSDLKWLLIGIAVSLFVILWGPITRNEQMVGVGVALLGFVVAKWPLATPETVRKVGYVASHNAEAVRRKGTEICRAIGVTVIPLGLTTTFFM